jgi:Sulfotransferase family
LALAVTSTIANGKASPGRAMTEEALTASLHRLFIVGLPRSGTSTLVHALRSIGYRGFAEGHLLGLLPALEETMVRYYGTWKADNVVGTMLNGVDLYSLMMRYRTVFRQLFEETIGPPPWLDKNAVPSILPYLKMIQSTWNDAAFIFTRRRPIDFIYSAMKKFPDRSFDDLCEAVQFTFNNWENQKANLHKYIEVDQSEFYDAERLAEKLIVFLGLEERIRSSLVENLRFQVERTADTYAAKQLADFRLTDQQREKFKRQCGAIMKTYYDNGGIPSV